MQAELDASRTVIGVRSSKLNEIIDSICIFDTFQPARTNVLFPWLKSRMVNAMKKAGCVLGDNSNVQKLKHLSSAIPQQFLYLFKGP